MSSIYITIFTSETFWLYDWIDIYISDVYYCVIIDYIHVNDKYWTRIWWFNQLFHVKENVLWVDNQSNKFALLNVLFFITRETKLLLKWERYWRTNVFLWRNLKVERRNLWRRRMYILDWIRRWMKCSQMFIIHQLMTMN